MKDYNDRSRFGKAVIDFVIWPFVVVPVCLVALCLLFPFVKWDEWQETRARRSRRGH